MTLISEQMFKPFSSCLTSTTTDHDNPPSRCFYHCLAVMPYQKGGPGWICKRLGRLLASDISQLEDGKSPAKLLKRGKLIARLAKAAKDLNSSCCTAPDPDQLRLAKPDQASCAADPIAPYPRERLISEPLGVEAFRMALSRELSLIRNKKEKIP